MSTRGRRPTGHGSSANGPKIAILATVAIFAVLFVLAPRGRSRQQGLDAAVDTSAAAPVDAMEPGGGFPLLQEPRAGVGHDLPASPLLEEPGDSAVAVPTL